MQWQKNKMQCLLKTTCVQPRLTRSHDNEPGDLCQGCARVVQLQAQLDIMSDPENMWLSVKKREKLYRKHCFHAG